MKGASVLLFFLEMFELELQLFDALDIVGVGYDAVDRADGDTCRFVVMARCIGPDR